VELFFSSMVPRFLKPGANDDRSVDCLFMKSPEIIALSAFFSFFSYRFSIGWSRASSLCDELSYDS
jgi:hypothetical protein